MATTGFWPVKGRLKEVILYAENPDKTTDSRFLDDDLYRALRYAEDDNKTDRKMYVSAINCPTKRAYEHMMATKQRYGKPGGNVAYHGFQSFRTGEVTPEQAHRIGMETAKRMWGRDYEIVVTTHLNTDNLHNHIVVNSVSFRTGKKFENHISDHYRLREISDEVCREHHLSVLPPGRFTGSRKKDYWVRKNGNLTHRDILKQDLEQILAGCTSSADLRYELTCLGYSVSCSRDESSVSVQAPGWKRPVRLESIGYDPDTLTERMIGNRYHPQSRDHIYRVKITPLLNLKRKLDYEIAHSKDTAVVLVDVLFYIFLELLRMSRSQEAQLGRRPHSPGIREGLTIERQLKEEYGFMKVFDLHTEENILDFIDSCSEEIAGLEAERTQIRNSNRRPKSQEEREQKNAAARRISEKLRPLRKDLKLAQSVLRHYPFVWDRLQEEKKMEIKSRNRIRERSYER